MALAVARSEGDGTVKVVAVALAIILGGLLALATAFLLLVAIVAQIDNYVARNNCDHWSATHGKVVRFVPQSPQAWHGPAYSSCEVHTDRGWVKTP